MTQMDMYSSHEAGSTNPHRLLLASAGTGKTFLLSAHFAALLLQGVEPERVLATTFTRKAAGEILDRVILRLREATVDGDAGDDQRRLLTETVHRFAPGAPAVTRGAALDVLERLVRRIDRFQVRTLDAFFVRLARLFAMELAIAPEWRITDEVEERSIVLEGVSRVLDELDFAERIHLVRAMTSGGAAMAAARTLGETVTKGDAIARDALPGAWEQLDAPEPVDTAEIERAIDTFRHLPTPQTKSGKDNATWTKLLAEIRGLLETHAGSTADFAQAATQNGLAKNVAEDKDDYGRAPIPPEARGAMATLMAAADAARLGDLIERNTASARFLERYAESDVALRAELGAYRFEDFPRALLNGPARGDRDMWTMELGYRLDARLDHLLLDEFQDTGPGQWRLLLPLVEEVLGDGSGERSFFCVGDVKQSIYGWRGGEPRLLGRMESRHPVLDAEPLVENYRSSSVILDVVNHVFHALPERRCFVDGKRAAAKAAATEWSEGFQDHVAKKAELRGAARLWMAPKGPKGDTSGPCIELAVERVAKLHDAHPSASIAVLVRAKKEIARMRFLLGRRGIQASDDGGNPLTDSVGVTWILGLLHLADHPGDGVAALQVARSPFAERYGVLPRDIGSPAGRAAAAAASAEVRAALVVRGYGAVCEELAAELLPGADPWNARRLEQLVDMAIAYDGRPTLRPIDFVELVRAQRVPDPSASRVKIMTIHASKGLEFDIVVLPELGRAMRLTPDEFLVGSDSEVEPPSRVTARPTKDMAQRVESLHELYSDAERRAAIDSLSGLYVAITRAVHCIEMIVPVPGKEPALSHASIVAEALGAPIVLGEVEGDDEGPEVVWMHEDSVEDWDDGHGAVAEVDHVPESELRLDAGRGEDLYRNALRPSGHSRESTTVEGALTRPEDDARRLGTLVHALFEGFDWAGDPERTDGELGAVCEQTVPGTGLVDAAVERYRAGVAAPGLAGVFMRPEGNVRVLHERSFDVEVADTDQDPHRSRGTIDRLVLRFDGAELVGAQIVDFKTEAGSEVSVLAAHRPQLEAYRAAVSALFGLGEADIECVIAWLDPAGGCAALVVD